MKTLTPLFLFLFFATMKISAQEDWALDTLQIGGIKQVIAEKGKAGAPIILFLHGGPGGSRMKQADQFSDELQKHFWVVQWDQRESGKTAALNQSNQAISLELMVKDTDELISQLLSRRHQKKLYLAGESWGTVLGFMMAERRPEKLHAYLAFAPVVDQIQSEKLLVKTLMDEAIVQKNTVAQTELKLTKIPFENGDQIYYLRKWWFSHDGKPLADKDTTLVKDYLRAWSATWLPTWKAAMERNLFTELPSIKCPVYFFLGGKDYQTNANVAKSYFDQLVAPYKKMHWFENASHDLLVTEARKVQRVVIDEVLKQ